MIGGFLKKRRIEVHWVFFLLAVLVGMFPSTVHAGDITEEEVREALDSFLQRQAPAGVEMTNWELRRGDDLPVKGEILDLEKAPGAHWKEATPMRIRIGTDTGKTETLWLTAHLSCGRTVVLATHNLPIGHRIGPEDVEMELREGWKINEDHFSRIEEVVGKSVWRPVSKGACIKKWHVKENRSMMRGDKVLITANKGLVHVEVPGQVLESGEPGDRIKVLNTVSGKEVFATVLDLHTVSVSF